MQGQLSSKSRKALFSSRAIAPRGLCALAIAAIAWAGPDRAMAQATSPGLQPTPGMGTTSPLDMRAIRSPNIPLGATEIATPGISPLRPPQGALMNGCAGPDGAPSSGVLFDGGGLSATTTLSCADSRNLSSPLPSASSIGRAGIPLGATELGSAGISPSLSAPAAPEVMLHRGTKP
jgi:hypothetical protein